MRRTAFAMALGLATVLGSYGGNAWALDWVHNDPRGAYNSYDDYNIHVGLYARDKGTSLALDSNGLPAISYFNDEDQGGHLNFTKYSESGWLSTQRVDDGAAPAGEFSSLQLKLGSGDVPRISYYDQYNGAVVYAAWDPGLNNGAGGWNKNNVGAIANGANYDPSQPHRTSLGLSLHGNTAYVSYFDGDKLKIFSGTDTGIDSFTEVTGVGAPFISGEGGNHSVVVDKNGVIHVVYTSPNATTDRLLYAYKDAVGWHSDIQVGSIHKELQSDNRRYNSLYVDDKGIAHISYYGSNDALMYAYNTGAGTNFTTAVVDTNVLNSVAMGQNTSLVVVNNKPYISYIARDEATGISALKVAYANGQSMVIGEDGTVGNDQNALQSGWGCDTLATSANGQMTISDISLATNGSHFGVSFLDSREGVTLNYMTDTPEPGTLLLLTLGMGMTGFKARRRRQAGLRGASC